MLSEMISGMILSLITNLSVQKLSTNIMYYLQGVVISKLIVFVIIKLMSYFSVRSDAKIDRKVLIMLMALPVSTLLIVYAVSGIVYDVVSSKTLYLLISAIILLVVSNIFIFYLLEYQLQMTEAKNEQTIIKNQLENKSKYYEELSKRQQITNKSMHDLKNQLFALRQVLKENQNEGIGILDELCEQINAAYTLKFTGIEAVDALITSKLVTMKENNIEFSNSIFISDKNCISITDMCVLLGNLLDNAIEANLNIDLDKKYISIKISQQMNYLSMCVSNSKNVDSVNIDINNIVTTKKQKELHSFGLRSVKEIVKKYDGNVTLRQEKNRFEVIILMKNI